VIAPGAKPRIHIEPPDRKGMDFKPTVLEVEHDRRVRWLGHFLIRGIFDREHTWELQPSGVGGCRFTQRERFSGLLVPLSGKLLSRTRRGVEAMNEALKRRCEANPS
jgi:hypothetical protein